MKDRLSLIAEPAGAVGHHALALGRPDRGAQVRFLAEAGFALAAFGRVERDDMVADLHRGYARAHLAHDSSAFMAKDRREDALRILALQRVSVGMAGARRHELEQNFDGNRAFEGNGQASCREQRWSEVS